MERLRRPAIQGRLAYAYELLSWNRLPPLLETRPYTLTGTPDVVPRLREFDIRQLQRGEYPLDLLAVRVADVANPFRTARAALIARRLRDALDDKVNEETAHRGLDLAGAVAKDVHCRRER